jgi:hypothetical protein
MAEFNHFIADAFGMWRNPPTALLRQVNMLRTSLVPMGEKLVGFDDDPKQ